MSEPATIYPAPPGEPLSEEYTVAVEGKAVPVYPVRVSAVPFNQRWPGYQRPLDQTEVAAAALWDMSAPVHVEVISRRAVETVAIRPRSRGLVPAVSGNRISFTMPAPGPITLEVNGSHHALHLFARRPAGAAPDRDDPNVLFFAPGVHDAGEIHLRSGQAVHIAGGAVVYGSIEARNATGIRIGGRGILDSSRMPRSHTWYDAATDGEPYGNIALYECEDVEISGLCLRDPNVYAITPTACRGVRIHDVSIVGLWRYNSDGIHFHNSEDCTVERCFVRSFDDSIIVNGLPRHRGCVCGDRPSRNITIRDCVLWNDWGRALRVGVANSAPEVRDVSFVNCDVIHAAHVILGMEHGGRARVSNILFDGIRVELDDDATRTQFQKDREEVYAPQPGDDWRRLLTLIIEKCMYSRDGELGCVDGVTLRNIRITGGPLPRSSIAGCDEDHQVENVTVENLVVNGTCIEDAAAGRFSIGDHVQNVTFKRSNHR